MTSPMDEMILRSALKNLEFERDAALKRADAACDERDRLALRLAGALIAAEGGDGCPPGSIDAIRDCPTIKAVTALRKRAEAAEAEVARLKTLLEAKQPYTPRVGDVVNLWHGSADIIPWVVTNAARGPHGDERFVTLCDPRHGVMGDRSGCYERSKLTFSRPATAEERAAAGLPAESPAAPRVLPEHLAWIEACAKHFVDVFDHPDNASMPRMVAARALVAAVARRDGALNAAAAKEVK